MELHPIWEKGSAVNSELWYVLSALGDRPSMRVGHTASFVADSGSNDGKVYFVAGANPDGQLNELYSLDLETFTWDTIDCKDLKARYEHIAFIPDSQSTKIYILLGAEKNGNVNDVQVFDTTTQVWESVQCTGQSPSPRTHHTTAQLGDCVYIFSGGEHGTDPVQDKKVYCFDASRFEWTVTESEEAPKARHGHILLAYGENNLLLHGGMAAQHFYDDMHVYDVTKRRWRNVKQRNVYPCARAAHGGVVVGNFAYVFGGMGRNGALDDLYRLDLTALKWQMVTIHGPAPTPRLDFAISAISVRIPAVENLAAAEATRLALEKLTVGEGDGEVRVVPRVKLTVNDQTPPDMAVPNPTPNTERYRQVQMLLVHGGMDTDGEIWDDTLVIMVDTE